MIALEATICLPLFVVLVMFVYSYSQIFEAKYTVQHALIETGKSMAMENYVITKTMEADSTSTWDLATQSSNLASIAVALGMQTQVKNPEYASYEKWSADGVKTMEVVKRRFWAYLAGDKDKADVLLESLRVKDGADGLKFEGTKIDGNDLVITVTFACTRIFDYQMFNIEDAEIQLTTRQALWNSAAETTSSKIKDIVDKNAAAEKSE